MQTLSADAIISALGLEPLGFEGGYYREQHRSALDLEGLPETYVGPRSAATAIYYLLTPSSLSLMHRLRTDEVYHFYLGDPVQQLLLWPDGRSETVTIGPDLLAGQRVQHVVPAGVWQGSRLVPGGRFALMGTTMAPGFDLADFELGDRTALVAAYPGRAGLLQALTPARLNTEDLELAAASLDLLHAHRRSREALAAGLRAQLPEPLPPGGPTLADLDAEIEALTDDPGRRGRGWWYLVRRADRALVGFARYDGAGGIVVHAPEALEAQVRRALDGGADPA